jgi:hypothetical protein
MAVLDIGADRKEEWLYDIYRMGRDAIEKGAGETYVLSADQWDPGTAAKLVNVLRWGGIEVERATSGFSAAGKSYPAGSYLVRGAQAFRPHLTDLLNPQVYPDRRLYPDGPPEKPYDITGWTLPYQMGVKVEKLLERVTVAATPVAWAKPDAAKIEGRGGWGYALDARANEAFTAVNRLMKAGATVSRTRAALGDWPPGAFVVRTGEEQITAAARDLGVRIRALGEEPSDLVALRAPRIGIYHGWGGNIDEGWTRWVLEQFEFPYSSIHDSDVRAGDLRGRFDVIVLPEASLSQMLGGLDQGTTQGGLQPVRFHFARRDSGGDGRRQRAPPGDFRDSRGERNRG